MSADLFDALLGILMGLVLLFWAGPLRGSLEQERESRLTELDAGAGEAFFEERREIEAYPLLGVAALRWLGGALVVLSLAFALPDLA